MSLFLSSVFLSGPGPYLPTLHTTTALLKLMDDGMINFSSFSLSYTACYFQLLSLLTNSLYIDIWLVSGLSSLSFSRFFFPSSSLPFGLCLFWALSFYAFSLNRAPSLDIKEDNAIFFTLSDDGFESPSFSSPSSFSS